MDRQFLIAHFEMLLPLAAKWAAAVEQRILREGVPLSEPEMADARAIGVCAPERVRLLALAQVPAPRNLTLRTAAAAIQFLTPETRGLALRYHHFRAERLLGRTLAGRARAGPHRAIRAARWHPAFPEAIPPRVPDDWLSGGAAGAGSNRCRQPAPVRPPGLTSSFSVPNRGLLLAVDESIVRMLAACAFSSQEKFRPVNAASP